MTVFNNYKGFGAHNWPNVDARRQPETHVSQSAVASG